MLFARAPFFFVGLLVLAGFAFTPLYLMQLEQANLARHYHAVFGTLWLLVLVVQPLSIQLGAVSLHRKLGPVALLIGAGFISSLWTGLHTSLLNTAPFFTRYGELVAMQQLQTTLVFMFLFYKAVEHRRTTLLHARYMIATGLLFIEPILERVLSFWIPGMMTSLDDIPFVMRCTHASVLIVCALLLWLEWRGERCFVPFLVVTAVTTSKVIVMHVFQTGTLWTSLSAWYAGLPVSLIWMLSLVIVLLMMFAGWRKTTAQTTSEPEVRTEL